MLFLALHHAFTPFLSLLYPYNRIEIYRLFAILFRCFYGYFVLNQVLFCGVLSCDFIALFECISPRLAQNRARLSAFYHPATEFSLSNRCFCLGLEHLSLATKEICWLVGWLVRLHSFRLFRLGQIVACRLLIIMPVFDKILSSDGFSSDLHTFETL